MRNIGAADPPEGSNPVGYINNRYQWLRADGTPTGPELGGASQRITIAQPVSLFRSVTTYSYFGTSIPADARRLRIGLYHNEGSNIVERDTTNNTVEIIRITDETTGEELTEVDEETVVEEIERELVGEEEEISPPAPTPTPSSSGGSSGSGAGPAEGQPAPSPASSHVSKFEPKILPGSPFYFLKTAWRETKAAFTFNSQKDAELRLRYANEKVLEANILIDQGKTDRAVNHLRSYTRDIEKVNQFTARLEKKDKAAAQKIAERATTHQLKHQILIGKIEGEVPAEKVVEVKEARDKILEQVAKTIEHLDTQKTEQILSAALHKNGSPFGQFRNVEVLKAVEEKVSEQAKDAVRKAQKNSLKQFSDQLEMLPDEHKKLFSGYVEKSGGDKTLYIKTFDDLKFKGLSEATHGHVLAAEEKVFERFDDQLQDVSAKEPGKAKKLFKHLRNGSIDNLRALRDIERNVAPSATTPIDEIKKEAFDAFIKRVKEGKVLQKEITTFSDFKQIDIIDELEKRGEKIITQENPQKPLEVSSMGEKRPGTRGIKEVLVREIKNGLDKAKTGTERENKERTVVGDNPQHLKLIDEFQGDLGKQITDTLRKRQAELLEKRIERIEDTERLKFFEEKMRQENTTPAFAEKVRAQEEKIKELNEKIKREIEETEQRLHELMEKAKNAFASLPSAVRAKYTRSADDAFTISRKHLERAKSALEAKEFG
ncbi:MAG: DUF5667 domain-containing protein, partial [Patescibacteria group bacterium]